jgi:large subunit ribosomal protein L18
MKRTMKRRRKQGRTDYLNRLKLLKSGKPRIVFRKSNKYVIGQYVTSKEAKDKIELGVSSKDLVKFGWPKENVNMKSITASYLTGYLMGKKIEKMEKPIVDLGMMRTIQKTKVFAFLKGLIDAGAKIQCKEETFPTEERIKGEHLKNKIDFDAIKSKIGAA